MKIKQTSITYEISDKGTIKGRELMIKVIDYNGNISILTNKGDEEFIFKNSSPEMIKKIGKLLVRASDI